MATIVVTTFELEAGVGIDVFTDADARYQQEVAYQLPGLLRRTTARADGNEWCVVETWADAASAVAWHTGELSSLVAKADRRSYDSLD